MAPQSKSQNERHKVILAQLLQKEGTVSYFDMIGFLRNPRESGFFGIPEIRFL